MSEAAIRPGAGDVSVARVLSRSFALLLGSIVRFLTLTAIVWSPLLLYQLFFFFPSPLSRAPDGHSRPSARSAWAGRSSSPIRRFRRQDIDAVGNHAQRRARGRWRHDGYHMCSSFCTSTPTRLSPARMFALVNGGHGGVSLSETRTTERPDRTRGPGSCCRDLPRQARTTSSFSIFAASSSMLMPGAVGISSRPFTGFSGSFRKC